MEKTISDEAIVAQMQSGDHSMFGILVNRYSKNLLNYIFRLSGSQQDAEDLLQELFVRIFRRINSFDIKRRFRPWMYRIATNICYDFLKKRKNTVSLDKSYTAGGEGENPPLLDAIPDEKFQPEKLLVQKEFIQTLHREVDELPHKQKEVFLLYNFEEFSYQEIADSLAIPLGTVKSRLHNACRRIYLNVEGGQAS